MVSNLLRNPESSCLKMGVYCGTPIPPLVFGKLEKMGEKFGEVLEVHNDSVDLEALDVVRLRIKSVSGVVQYAPMVVSDGVDTFKVMVYANLSEENKWGGIWISLTEEELRAEEIREEEGLKQKGKPAAKVGEHAKDCFGARLPKICVKDSCLSESEGLLSPTSVKMRGGEEAKLKKKFWQFRPVSARRQFSQLQQVGLEPSSNKPNQSNNLFSEQMGQQLMGKKAYRAEEKSCLD